MEKLYIVVPAYNEEANIEAVVKEWHDIVENISEESKLVVIDDGSKDGTFAKLKDLEKLYPQLEVLTKKNSGHGATLLFGYQYALDAGADYIFQTDSDGQTVAAEFADFWAKRNEYDVIIGERKKREDGISRVFVTKTLKFVLRMIFGIGIKDANTPFRLMKREILAKYIVEVPKDFNLSNVMLVVLFMHNKEKVLYLPITFRPRQGGKNSINIRSICKIGWKAVKDFKEIKKRLK